LLKKKRKRETLDDDKKSDKVENMVHPDKNGTEGGK
jgi:hypothetical protein